MNVITWLLEVSVIPEDEYREQYWQSTIICILNYLCCHTWALMFLTLLFRLRVHPKMFHYVAQIFPNVNFADNGKRLPAANPLGLLAGTSSFNFVQNKICNQVYVNLFLSINKLAKNSVGLPLRRIKYGTFRNLFFMWTDLALTYFLFIKILYSE